MTRINLVGVRQVCRRLKDATPKKPVGVYVAATVAEPNTWGVFTTDIFIGYKGVTFDAKGQKAGMEFVQLVEKPMRYKEVREMVQQRFSDFEF
mgnify:FL=1